MQSSIPWPAVPMPISLLTVFLHRQLMHVWNVPVRKISNKDGLLYNPVPNPVSFNRRHYSIIDSPNYVVSGKTDGDRCVFFATKDPDGIPINVLIDRRSRFYTIRAIAHSDVYKDIGTCLDGELVKAQDKDEHGNDVWHFVAFDAVCVKGESLILESSYARRLERAKDVIGELPEGLLSDCADGIDESCIDNIRKIAASGKIVPLPFNFSAVSDTVLNPKSMQFIPHIRLHVKEVYSMSTPYDSIQNALRTRRGWNNDGLIFTPLHAEIKMETHLGMIKVKEVSSNTVDFRIVVEKVPRQPERIVEFRYQKHGEEIDICRSDIFPFQGYNFCIKIDDSPALQTILARFRSDRSTFKHDTIVECTCELNINHENIVSDDCSDSDVGNGEEPSKDKNDGGADDDVIESNNLNVLRITVIRERHDKMHPNNWTTLLGTLDTIYTGIGCTELLAYFKNS